MSETVKSEKKRDKKENLEETRRAERIGQFRYTDFAKGLVVFDNIRKEINKRERRLEKIRVSKYEHLRGEFWRKILAEECAVAGIPVETFERKPRKNESPVSPIELKASPPVPNTSSKFVGWRSSRPEYDLEFVGPLHISAKRTIEPPLLPDEFRVTDQRFIFLG